MTKAKLLPLSDADRRDVVALVAMFALLRANDGAEFLNEGNHALLAKRAYGIAEAIEAERTNRGQT